VIIYIQCVLRERARWFVDLAKGGDKHIQRSLSVCVCCSTFKHPVYSVSRLISYQKSKAFLKRLYVVYLVLGIIVVRDLQRGETRSMAASPLLLLQISRKQT
jgi:hypothetical protein